MNKIVAVSAAAAIPVAMPSIASEVSPDHALIELGKAFDERVARVNYYLNLDTDGRSEDEVQARDDSLLGVFANDEIFLRSAEQKQRRSRDSS